MNRNTKKLTVLCLLIFSNILATENGYKEIDGTIVVYKRPSYRNAALCSTALLSLYSYYIYTFNTHHKATFAIIPLAASAYLFYCSHIKKEPLITLTREGLTVEHGKNFTWKNYLGIRKSCICEKFFSKKYKFNRRTSFALLGHTEITIKTDDMMISNSKLIDLIKQINPVKVWIVHRVSPGETHLISHS